MKKERKQITLREFLEQWRTPKFHLAFGAIYSTLAFIVGLLIMGDIFSPFIMAMMVFIIYCLFFETKLKDIEKITNSQNASNEQSNKIFMNGVQVGSLDTLTLAKIHKSVYENRSIAFNQLWALASALNRFIHNSVWAIMFYSVIGSLLCFVYAPEYIQQGLKWVISTPPQEMKVFLSQLNFWPFLFILFFLTNFLVAVVYTFFNKTPSFFNVYNVAYKDAIREHLKIDADGELKIISDDLKIERYTFS